MLLTTIKEWNQEAEWDSKQFTCATLSFPSPSKKKKKHSNQNLHSQSFFILLLPDSVACRMKCEEKQSVKVLQERVSGATRCKKDVRWGQMGREDEYKGLKVFQVHNTFNAPFRVVCVWVSFRQMRSSLHSFLYNVFLCPTKDMTFFSPQVNRWPWTRCTSHLLNLPLIIIPFFLHSISLSPSKKRNT